MTASRAMHSAEPSSAQSSLNSLECNSLLAAVLAFDLHVPVCMHHAGLLEFLRSHAVFMRFLQAVLRLLDMPSDL